MSRRNPNVQSHTPTLRSTHASNTSNQAGAVPEKSDRVRRELRDAARKRGSRGE